MIAKQEKAAAAAARQLPITTVTRPTLVSTVHLQGSQVHDFAFASTHSAALVLTCLKKVYFCLNFCMNRCWLNCPQESSVIICILQDAGCEISFLGCLDCFTIFTYPSFHDYLH